MVDKSDKAILKNSFFYNGLNTVQSIVFGFLTSLLFTRILGLNLFGEFSLISSYISIFFAVVSSGILTGFRREAIRYSTSGKNVGNFLFIIFIFTSLTSGLFTSIILFYEDSFTDLFRINMEHRSILLFYLLVHVIIYFPGRLMIFTLESFQDIKPVYKISLVSNVLKLVGITSLLYLPVEIGNAVIVFFLIPNLIVLFFSYKYLRNNYNITLNVGLLYDSYESLKSVLLYSFRLYPLMLSELILGNIAIIVLSRTGTEETIGIFKVLFNYYTVLKFVPQFLGKVISPTLTKLYFENELTKVNIYYNFGFKLSIILCSLITLVFVVWLNELLGIYGISGRDYSLSMIVLLLSNLVLSVSLIGGVFQAYNYPHFISLFVGIGSFLNLILSIYLIPYYGVLGGCIAIFFNNFIAQLGLHIFAIKKIRFRIDIMRFTLSLGLVIGMGGVLIELNQHNNAILAKLLCNIVVVILYLFFIKVSGFFDQNESLHIRAISKKSNNKNIERLVEYIVG